jgi:DNA adenine methylase Dam
MENQQSFRIENRRYLGSKLKLVDFIINTLNRENIKFNSVADLFAGTGYIASKIGEEKHLVINDHLYSNYVIYNGFLRSDKINISKINKLIFYYNETKPKNDNYFSKNYGDKYFTKENARKIGFIRQDIEDKYLSNLISKNEYFYMLTSLIYSLDRIANTVGHYEAYRKDGLNDRKIHLKKLECIDEKKYLNIDIQNEEANVLAEKIKVDLVYLDPPYNSRQYGLAYHLLENLVTWKKPNLFGISKKPKENIKSIYSTEKAVFEFEELINKLDCKYIVLSYNDTGKSANNRSNSKMKDSDIIRILEKKGKVKIFESEHKNFSSGKSKNIINKERIFICFVGQKKEFNIKVSENKKVKSPLNYIGGKYKQINQLITAFPNDYSVFVDLFGGGFNVGVNSEVETVIYNEKSRQLFDLINYIKNNDYSKINNSILGIIKEFCLSDTLKNGYDFYDTTSDKGLGKYNVENYNKLRNFYNKNLNNKKRNLILLVLIIFSFNNQIRFNKKNEFNVPVGKRDYNSNIRKNLSLFCSKMRKINKLVLKNLDFEDIDLSAYENTDLLVYCDPPYLISKATYNENGGWTEESEKRLLTFLSRINKLGIRFALSNLLFHKNSRNNLLIAWINENNFRIININSSYNNSNYQTKNVGATKEVLIVNY